MTAEEQLLAEAIATVNPATQPRPASHGATGDAEAVARLDVELCIQLHLIERSELYGRITVDRRTVYPSSYVCQRIVDSAAVAQQRLRAVLQYPALLFVP